MSKFTPGPWKVHGIEKSHVYNENGIIVADACVSGGPNTIENAQLIAASPDLYIFALVALGRLKAANNPDNTDCIKIGEAAIAKVEGKVS